MLLDENARKKKLEAKEKREILQYLTQGKNINLAGSPHVVVDKVTGKDIADLGTTLSQ